MVVIIEGLEINEFKNIEREPIDFGDFNIIIGPSNVGKSNILRAISISSKTTGGIVKTLHDHVFLCDKCTKIKSEISSHVEFRGVGYDLEKYDQSKGTGKTEITYKFNKELILYYWLNKNHSKIPEIFKYIQKSNPDIKSSQYIGYLFNWDNVPGNDSEKLLRFLKDLNIGWAENAEIRKSDDYKTILIIKDKNSAEIMIDENKEKATLKIRGGRTHDLPVKKENGKLNIYGYYIDQMLNGGLAKFIHSQNDAKKILRDNFAEYYINFLSSLLNKGNEEELLNHLKEDVKNSLFTVKLVFNINAIPAEHISVLHEVQNKKTIFYEITDNVVDCPDSRLRGYKDKSYSDYISGARSFTGKDLEKLEEFICKVVGPPINVMFNNAQNAVSLVFDGFEIPIDEQGSGLRSVIGPAWDILAAKEGSIVIIDEPELGLHPSAKQEFLKKLLEEAENKQIFIATHDPTFVNPEIWQEFIREMNLEKFSVKVLLYSFYTQSFKNVDLYQSKEDPETFAGYLPHTTSLKKVHIYVEGASDVCVFQIWLEKYLREKCRRNWLKKFNGIGIYHLGGDNWMNLLYTIPREPYKCMVILDGDKSKAKVNAKEVCEKYNKAEFENISRFKFCGNIGEISFDSDHHHPVYCLNMEEIECYFDPVLLTICIVDQSKLDSVPLNMEIKTIRELKEGCNNLFSLKETNPNIYEYQQGNRKLIIDLDQKAAKIVADRKTLLKLSEVDGRIEIKDIKIKAKEIYGSLIADKMDVPDEIKKLFDAILEKNGS